MAEEHAAAEGPAESPKHTKRQRSRKEAAEPPSDEPHLDVSERALARRAEIKSRPWFTDAGHGIHIVTEEEIAPGATARRVRIEFDRRPPKEERDLLKREGFSWADDVEAWTMANTAHVRELAKKTVNLIYKQRGLDPGPVLTPLAARF